MKSPAFQFYPDAFLADENVVLMTNQQVGCYIKLLCYCWREGSIPGEIPKIAKLCGEDGSAMAQLWQEIKPCFVELPNKPGRLINPRLEEERNKQEQFRKERSEAGKKGGKARWANDSDDQGQPRQSHSSANGSAIAQPMANDSSLSLSLSSSDKTNEEEEKEKALAYIKRVAPNWVNAGEKYRKWLEWEDKFPWPVIQMAVEETVAAGVNRLSYADGILADWDEHGARTMEQVLVRQAQRKAELARRQPQGNRGGTSPPKSNVFLHREKQGEENYDHVFKKFDD